MAISTVYVQPRHHGGGLRRLLLEHGMNYVRNADSPSGWLTTNSENTPAIAFYPKQSFQNSALRSSVFRTKPI
ncbi:N-acetyltransferase [Brucella gallinifaecis]|uniref:GNAT family N-acetyltransferase n=1 Tax=Brucella gallinifaecis TaxID=215590 RepID=UPI002360061A|nr:GNAT family N-acetyltransferase [Brucella gallinifaecis]